MKYLVYALQGLGDALESTPIIAGIRRFDRNAEIEVAVSRSGPALLFRQLPEFVSRVIELPYWERGFGAVATSLIANARRTEYVASFMAYPAAKSAYHAINALFKAKEKFGHQYEKSRLTNFSWSYTDLVPVRRVHNVERNLDLLAAARIPYPDPIKYLVPPGWMTEEPRDPARITIHVGTIAHDGFENKRWPLEKFAEVARTLSNDGYEIWLLAGPSEYADTRQLHIDLPRSQMFTGSLRDTAAHLSSSALVLTNDSGIGHLAAAVRTPVVTLLGPTPSTGSPYGPTSHPLRTSPCPPCFDPLARGIRCVLDIDFSCLKRDLTVAQVLEHIYRVLDREMTEAKRHV